MVEVDNTDLDITVNTKPISSSQCTHTLLHIPTSCPSCNIVRFILKKYKNRFRPWWLGDRGWKYHWLILVSCWSKCLAEWRNSQHCVILQPACTHIFLAHVYSSPTFAAALPNPPSHEITYRSLLLSPSHPLNLWHVYYKVKFMDSRKGNKTAFDCIPSPSSKHSTQRPINYFADMIQQYLCLGY